MNSLRASLLLVIFSVGMAFSSPKPTGDPLEMIDVTRMPYLKDGIVTQVSSYDRTGGNEDGFNGTYSYLYKENGKLVIFDAKGPGCIYRIWSANPDKGRLKFYFDGETEPRIDLPTFQDLFLGKYPPFEEPFSKHFLGGWCSYIPIPFQNSLKIVTDGPMYFLQITWQKFPADRAVKTYSGYSSNEERAKLKMVKKAFTNLGDDPWPVEHGWNTHIGRVVGSGESVDIFNQDACGMIREIHIKPVSNDPLIYRHALIKVFVDGQKQPNVWSPLGDFFLDGMGQGISQSLLLGKKNGEYFCYFPMPFEHKIQVKITNESTTDLNIDSDVKWETMKKIPSDMCRFYAWWHNQFPTIKGQNFPMLEAVGKGQYVGCSHAMSWKEHHLFFLEGDEMMWIDNRDNSYYNGTGTEDYFNGGWYFGETGSAPYYGCGVFDPKGGRCLAYRLQISDCVPFQQKATISMEHSPENVVNANYAGVTYWYAMPGTTHTFQPVPVDKRIPEGGR